MPFLEKEKGKKENKKKKVKRRNKPRDQCQKLNGEAIEDILVCSRTCAKEP